MPRTTSTNRPRTRRAARGTIPTAPTRTAPPAGDRGQGRTPAEGRLWAALSAHANSTTSELAGHAGVGKSTAGKILSSWHAQGRVTRTPAAPETATGRGRHPAVRWAVTETEPPAEPDRATAAGKARAARRHRPDGTTTASTPAVTARLGKGVLRGMVADFLTDHAGEAFSPSAIGKALDRSAGAVANALDTLTADRWAVRVSDAPKRYATQPATPHRTS